MTQYDDVPRVTALHSEQQQVRAAIVVVDAGGTLTSLVVTPPPPPPPDPDKISTTIPVVMLAVNVTSIGAVTAATMSAIKTQLAARDAAITAELATLGVA